MTTKDQDENYKLSSCFNTAANGLSADGLEPQIARELGRATGSGVDTGFIARADHFGFWELQLKELAQNIKKKKDDLRQLLATLALEEAYQKAQDFTRFLDDESQKWRKHAEEALDDLQKFTNALPMAIEAFKKGDLRRDKDGNFKNDDIQMIVILSMDHYGMNPEDWGNMTDGRAAAYVQQVIADQDKITADLTDRYEVSKEVADILEEAKVGLSKTVEDILNQDDWDDQRKKEGIMNAIKDCVPKALETVEISQDAHKILKGSAKEVLNNSDPVLKIDSGFSIK